MNKPTTYSRYLKSSDSLMRFGMTYDEFVDDYNALRGSDYLETQYYKEDGDNGRIIKSWNEDSGFLFADN